MKCIAMHTYFKFNLASILVMELFTVVQKLQKLILQYSMKKKPGLRLNELCVQLLTFITEMFLLVATVGLLK